MGACPQGRHHDAFVLSRLGHGSTHHFDYTNCAVPLQQFSPDLSPTCKPGTWVTWRHFHKWRPIWYNSRECGVRPIPSKLTTFDWILLLAAAILLFSLALLLFIDSTHAPTLDFLKKNWGNIASVLGFLLSIYVLVVARGARAAAREARLRTVLEDLQDASEKCNDVGLFAEDQTWALVKLRAAEVESACRSITARWEKDNALKQNRNRLLEVAELMLSIVEAIDNQVADRQTVLAAQRNSNTKLAVVVGRMQGTEESRST